MAFTPTWIASNLITDFCTMWYFQKWNILKGLSRFRSLYVSILLYGQYLLSRSRGSIYSDKTKTAQKFQKKCTEKVCPFAKIFWEEKQYLAIFFFGKKVIQSLQYLSYKTFYLLRTFKFASMVQICHHTGIQMNRKYFLQTFQFNPYSLTLMLGP